MSDSARMKSPVAPGDVVAGKYRIERVLGAGGMGVVVAATHLELDQPVALKFILPHALAGKGNVERFMREARAVVRLKSEHVARVYDVGRDAEDRPFMVLELLEGMDLARLSRERGPLPVADSVEYVLQACEALVEAHAAGIVHRDLKPQNLFVTRRLNGTPLLKVLDFGIAKAIGPGAVGQMALTDSAAIIGSPLYMAPEQMRSARTAEVRSDIWALGVILYELLGGQVPFDGENVTEVCIRVVNEEPPALHALRPALDASLVAIVARCLQKDPEARFQNVSSLAAALEPFSRSAQQGGLVRPWRSFEDTQDSQGGGNPFAAARSSADATGPSTAVSIQTLDAISLEEPSEEVRRARALAGSTKASPGTKRASNRGQESPQLVSTDVTWGQSASMPASSRPRSFSLGMVALMVVPVAAAAVVAGLLVGRGSSTPNMSVASGSGAAESTKAPSTSGPGASEGAPIPAQPDAGAPRSAEALPAATEAQEGKPVHAAAGPTATSPGPGRPGASGKGARTSSGVRGAQPSPAGAPSPAASSRPPDPAVDPLSPNGAPILR